MDCNEAMTIEIKYLSTKDRASSVMMYGRKWIYSTHCRLIRYIYGEAKKEGEEYRLGTEIRGDPPMITGAALVAAGRDTVLHTQHPDPRCC